jgi:hypothetical protein
MASGNDLMKLLTSPAHLLFAIAVSAFFVTSNIAQTPPPSTPSTPGRAVRVTPKIKQRFPKVQRPADLPPGIEWGDGDTTERSIMVDPKVSVQVCVTEGTVKVNGWARNEVRAFVSDGSKFGFRVLQKSAKGDSPVLISLVGIKQTPGGTAVTTDCIAGDEVELDVPQNTALTLRGQENETSIDTLRKVFISNAGGDISIRNVAEGVRAETLRGNITVESSQGGMSLGSQSGNIVAYDVQPSDVGDTFRAKTSSGAISLQKMQYRLSDVNSISGSVVFTGALPGGGAFNFSTTNGSIRLLLPPETSCRITAIYGFGSFNSEIPVKDMRKEAETGPVKTFVGTLGAGDCALKLTTNSGSVVIRKLQP